MAAAPHLVTVRTAGLVPRNWPNGAELNREKNTGDHVEDSEPEFQYTEPMRPHTSASNHRKVNRAKNLTTVFSYGDPAQPLYKNKEVDLMGVDGIIYHGRLDSTLPSYPSDKEPSGLKSPQPPFRLERARSATAHRQSGFSFSRSNSKSAWSSQNALHIPSSSDSLQQSSDS